MKQSGDESQMGVCNAAARGRLPTRSDEMRRQVVLNTTH